MDNSPVLSAVTKRTIVPYLTCRRHYAMISVIGADDVAMGMDLCLGANRLLP